MRCGLMALATTPMPADSAGDRWTFNVRSHAILAMAFITLLGSVTGHKNPYLCNLLKIRRSYHEMRGNRPGPRFLDRSHISGLDGFSLASEAEFPKGLRRAIAGHRAGLCVATGTRFAPSFGYATTRREACVSSRYAPSSPVVCRDHPSFLVKWSLHNLIQGCLQQPCIVLSRSHMDALFCLHCPS